MAPRGRYFRYDPDRGRAGQSKYFRLIGGLTSPNWAIRSRTAGLIVAAVWPIIANGQGIALGQACRALAAQGRIGGAARR